MTTSAKRVELKRIEPMEARSVDAIPVGAQWQYEPKWDGFRCMLARDGATVTMTSKSGQDLTRYFPEIAQSAAEFPEPLFALDGELVVLAIAISCAVDEHVPGVRGRG